MGSAVLTVFTVMANLLSASCRLFLRAAPAVRLRTQHPAFYGNSFSARLLPFNLDMTDEEAYKYYNCKRWKRLRIKILQRDHYECQRCAHRIRQAAETGEQLTPDQRHIRRAVCVHHIQELKDRPDLAYDPDNLVSLCHRCHDEVHERSVEDFRKYRFSQKKQQIAEERW